MRRYAAEERNATVEGVNIRTAYIAHNEPHINAIARPSGTILIMQMSQAGYTGRARTTMTHEAYQRLQWVHGGGQNFVLYDGSAKFIMGPSDWGTLEARQSTHWRNWTGSQWEGGNVLMTEYIHSQLGLLQ
jgi:hypothetical protein